MGLLGKTPMGVTIVLWCAALIAWNLFGLFFMRNYERFKGTRVPVNGWIMFYALRREGVNIRFAKSIWLWLLIPFGYFKAQDMIKDEKVWRKVWGCTMISFNILLIMMAIISFL